ncbi:MAG: glycerol-3-phosphate 1-O-acyltransferase PlsY [Clostridia bacterium]|nr:glycerol-3-phosphate 1-O-acyltransferase PlsY [Clostridia bacterium]
MVISDLFHFLSYYWIAFILTAIAAYLLGSINFAILTTQHFEKTDIRNSGSGNAGMTNVMRSVGKKAGIITFVGDIAKGAVAVMAGYLIFWAFTGKELDSVSRASLCLLGAYIAGFFDIIGHVFPVFFQFRGGKGVATSVGIMAFVDWRSFLIVFAVFLIVVLLTKYVSAGSVLGAITFPISVYFLNRKSEYSAANEFYLTVMTVVAALIGLIVVIKHKDNIKRLLRGEESKFTIKGEKKK